MEPSYAYSGTEPAASFQGVNSSPAHSCSSVISCLDIALYCHDEMLASGLQHLLNVKMPSLRVQTTSSRSALLNIVKSAPGIRVVSVLSGEITNILTQLRTLLYLQHACERLMLMVLYCDAASGLRALLPAHWVSLQEPVGQLQVKIANWLKESAPTCVLAPLSQLTDRQRDVLLRLARGQSLREVAQALGISDKTVCSHRFDVQARLGISRHTGWILLCAALVDPTLPLFMYA
ncbi:helix-turn-helix transcriptional regulator [Enterobacter cancerogenus]|uniref:helix-turn-helix transcriptional regulator n=1 Tax=Enterobacter cancerogenus TaxID=69218 RepID=UPI0030767A79